MPLREVQIMNRSRVVPEGTTRRYREGNFHNSYTTLNELGRGRFAVVRKCKHKETSRHFAAKFVRKRKMGRDCREDILKEIRILESSTLNPRLIGLHEVYETSAEVILVLEYASGGELHQYCVADKEDGFCERDVVRLLHQIIEGVHYLHKQNIAHLDLKPQNILLTSKEVGSGDIKLIDFGIARYLNKEEEIRDIQGTPDYVAPEILNYEPITLATDMWSVGVLTYVMLTGNSPFAGDTKQETFLNISQVNLEFPEEDFGSLSTEAQDFIQSLCVKEPEKRLSAAECLQHPWVRKFTEEEELERELTGTNENLQHQDENSNTSQVSSLTVELVIREDKATPTITKLKDDENENYLENNVARFVSAKELEVSDSRTEEPVTTEDTVSAMSRDDSISDMDVHMECDTKDGHEVLVSQEVKIVSLEVVQPSQRSTTERHVSLGAPGKPESVAVPVQDHVNHSTENFSTSPSPSPSEAGLLGDRACQRCNRSHTDLQVVSPDRGHSPSSSPLGTRRGICPNKENLPSGIREPKRFCLEVPGQQPGQVVC